MGSKDNEILGLTRMTKKSIMDSCKKNKLYQTPALNDVLYLHYQGYQEIDCLDDYTTLKCLWLESNAISQIAGLENQKELRSLYLHNNLIKKIENLENCKDLDTLNISHNHIARVENCGIGILPVLTNLNLSHNYLKTLENLQGLVDCKEVSVLDLSNNRIDDILIVKLLSEMPKLKVLVLMGNPVVNSIPQYRKTLILECKQLTYLDTRPIFPKDRACAEAWKRGGYDEEMREHKLWAKKERQKMRDSVNATLRLRKNARCKDEIPFMDSSDEDDEHKDYGIILPPIKNNEHLGDKMEDGKHREPIAQEEQHLELIVSCNNVSPRLGLEDNTSDAELDKLKEKGAKFREILGDFQEPVKKDFHGELNENTNNFQLESINETAAPKTDRIMIENITPVKPKLKKVRIMVGDITPIERNKAPVIPIPTRATRQLFYEQNDSERINTIDFLDIFNDWNYNFFEIDASFEIKDITVNEVVADLMEDEKHTANVESCDVVKPSLNDSENVDENEVDQTFLDSHNLFLENICHKIKDLDISSGSQIDVLESPCTDHIPPNTSIKSTDDKNCVIFKMQTIKDLRRNPMTPENIDAIENLSEELHQIKCKQFDEESRKLDELLLTLNVEREKNNEIVENLRTQLFNIKTNCNAIYDRFDNIEKGKEIDFGNSFDLTSGFNSSESLN